jgi:hypothetical protein
MRRAASIFVVAAGVLAIGAGAAAQTPPYRVESLRLDDVAPLALPTRFAVDWCGNGQPTAVDRKPEVDLSSPRQVHITYAVPADAADQFAAFASKIASDASAMDAWWRGQDPSRTLRFDLFAFPGCATQFGKLDIGYVRLPRVGSLYQGDAGADRLIADLGELTAATSEKQVIYYDGPPVYDQFVCGTTFVSSSAPTAGGRAGIAFIWMRSLCGGDIGAGGLDAAVVVHEIIHGLGALVQSGAPHECPPPDDGHVCDSPTDILYPSVTSQTTLSTEALDVGRDDYYGHSGAWFDVQDSGWLSHLPQQVLTIGVRNVGAATGAVAMTTPSAFECGGCSLLLDLGTPVTLVARPATGARFSGWSGACTGTAACVITLDAATSVTATFARPVFRLTVGLSGKGRVASTPAGVSCPGRCSASFPSQTKVRLRANAAARYQFAGWTGACRGKSACVVLADRNRAVRATFVKKKG